LSPDTLLKKIIRPPAIRAGIKGKAIGGHSIHSLATNLRAAGVDLKTTQELLRHANSRVTLDVYTRAISATKREANNRVMEMVFEAGRKKLSAPSSAPSRGAKGGNQKRCGPFRFSYFYEIQGQLGTEEVDREVKVSCTADCKYPPAEPEALDFEPLKAVRSLLMPTSLLGLARTNDCAQHLHLSFASQSNIQKQKTVAYARKCQTSTATPAEPGDLPFGLDLPNLFRPWSRSFPDRLCRIDAAANFPCRECQPMAAQDKVARPLCQDEPQPR
jgi:hypothetical protein